MATKKDEYATDLSPQLRRSAALYAPFTNHMQGNDAAAAKLVTNRLQRSGAPMPSTVGPPAPAVAQPPRREIGTGALIGGLARAIERNIPASSGAAEKAFTSVPNETIPSAAGRVTRGIIASTVGAPVELAGRALVGTADAAGQFFGGVLGSPTTRNPLAQGRVGVGDTGVGATVGAQTQAAPVQPIAQPPASSGVVASPLDRPGFSPAPTQAAAPAQDTTMLGPLRRAQQPGEVGRSVSGRQLPGSPQVGADGSIVYDQAFMDRNKPLIAQYQQQNVVPTVVPPPGVAASTATGGNMPSGPLTRRPAGFTASDRAAQLDALDRLGRSNAETEVRKALRKAAKDGDAAAVAQLAGAVGTLASPPLEPMRRGMAESAARLGMDQSRLAMDQGKAQADAEAQGVDTRARALQLKQAEQMQALTQQLMQGTPEEKQAAAQSLAALQGTKPGEPIKVKRQVQAVNSLGDPVMGDEEVLYDPRTGQWIQPPQGGQSAGSKQIPQGMTEQSVLAEAQAAIAAGKDPAAVAAMLSEYGLTLPN